MQKEVNGFFDVMNPDINDDCAILNKLKSTQTKDCLIFKLFRMTGIVAQPSLTVRGSSSAQAERALEMRERVFSQSARGFYDEGSSVTEGKIPPTPFYKGGGLHGSSVVKEMQNTEDFLHNRLDCFATARNDERMSTQLADDKAKLNVKDLFTYSLINLFTPKNTSYRLSDFKKKTAFTLAEVLITLGIIGVVAAMTMPTLLSKYRKSVVISKLQKISSAVGQAHNMATATYGTDYKEAFDAYDPESAEEMFNKYYKPFMKISKIEKGEKGVFAYLTDGTALYFFRQYRDPNIDGWHNTYFIACLTHKACETLDETSLEVIMKSLGVERFTIYTNGTIPYYRLKTYGREFVLEHCKKQTNLEACTALIGGDGWVIKDDYPFKI